MKKGWRKIRSVLSERSSLAWALAYASLVACVAMPLAQAEPADANLTGAERWAWSQISKGLPADFGDHCGVPLDPKKEEDPGWADPGACRTISGDFLVKLFTKPTLHDALTYKGVEIHDARIVGDVALDFAKIDRPLQLQRNQFVGEVSLQHAHAEGLINLADCLLSGAFDSYEFRSKGDLNLRGVTLESWLNLSLATISGVVNLAAVTCGGDLNADGLQVGQNMYMRSGGEDKASFKGVILRGAKITGQLGMTGAIVEGTLIADSLQVGQSLFMRSEGENKANFKAVRLVGAKITGQLSMSGASFDGTLEADNLQVGEDMYMRSEGENKASFKDVSLRGAKITGQLAMTGAIVEGTLNADNLHVGQDMYMLSDDKNTSSFNKVNLTSGKVIGRIDMSGVHFNGNLEADSLEVGGNILIRPQNKIKPVLKYVDLRNSKIAGEIAIVGATFDGDLDAHSLQVGGPLYMYSDDENKAIFKNVNLRGAKIGGQFDLHGAIFDGDLNAEDLQVGGALLMKSDHENKARFTKKVILDGASVGGRVVIDGAIFGDEVTARGFRVAGEVSLRNIFADAALAMPFAQLGANLDLGGANLADNLDLRGASIAGEMRFGDKTSMIGWRRPEEDHIDLRNAHVGSLSDNKYSWPRHLRLDGFSFAHLGGYEADSGSEMVERGADFWARNFAELDDLHPSPYEQLAGAFAAVGEHDAADDIHYAEQVRADQTIGWSNPLLLGWRWLLRWGAGYGVGEYMFRALYCAIGLALIGAFVLHRWVPEAAARGPLWCFGASVNRLLPVVDLKKESKDFFDEPKNFTPRQDFFFTALAALGWVLGLIVLAAMATITHGS